MANKVINSRVVMKHDISTNWEQATNFTPLAGEIIVYSDLNKFKIGDGTTLVGNLPFSEADLRDFIGATSQAAGEHGLVPAPAAGQQERFLKGDGTWGRLTKVLMYSDTIVGDGTTTLFTVNHNLNTKNLIVQVTDSTTFATILVDTARTSANAITLEFSEAPASGRTYVVLCTGYLETDTVPSEFVVDSIQGDGTTTLFTITHNFNTRNVLVQVTDAVNFANVIVEVYRPTVNTIQVEFTEAPAANEMFNVMCFKCQDVHALQDANWEAF